MQSKRLADASGMVQRRWILQTSSMSIDIDSWLRSLVLGGICCGLPLLVLIWFTSGGKQEARPPGAPSCGYCGGSGRFHGASQGGLICTRCNGKGY
ncbi:hypothetical protein TK50_21170 [Micromonospora haikouensis]|uniref:Uncharacterized protein n=1 Tax=Micromonospora haikouensis TaxID=686309 RepID=A0A0D0WXJ1_9ACTN|nr:hypothetical protein TK50_21170 [Micromonospora haikouensis]